VFSILAAANQPSPLVLSRSLKAPREAAELFYYRGDL
jgi:hypothetical protein